MLLEFGMLAALGAMLFWGVGDFLIQRSARKIGDLESLAFITVLGSLGLLPFVFQDFHLLLQPANLLLLGILGLIGFAVAVINFEALKKGKLSVVEVVLEVELPLTAILGFVFLGESLSLVHIPLVAAVFIGIVLIAMKPGKRRLEKGAFLALLTAAGMAAINFITTVGSREVSPLLAIWMLWAIPAALSLLAAVKRDGARKLLRNGSRFKKLVLPMAFFDTAAWVLFSLAVLENELAVTIAVTEAYPAVAILLGYFLNSERIHRRQWAGVIVAISSSIGIALIV